MGLGHLLVEGARQRHQRNVARREPGLGGEPAQHLAAVAVGQGPVEEQQVVAPGFLTGAGEAVEQLAAAAHRLHVVDTAQLEDVDERQAGLGVVVGHQHAQGRQGLGGGVAGAGVAGQRDLDDEAAALAQRALDADRAVHRRHQPAHDGEAQPGAAVAAGGGAVGLHEVVEEVLDLIGPQADPGVFDAEAHPLPPGVAGQALDAQRDVAGGGELDRVGEQVAEHLADPQGVAGEAAGKQVGAVAAGLEEQLDALLEGGPLDQHEGVGDQVFEAEGDALELEAAGLDLGEVEDVVEGVEERPPGDADLAGVIPLARRQAAAQQQVGHADHRVERGADLVAHVGQEQRLGLGGGFRPGARLLQLAADALALADVPLDGVGHRVEGGAQGLDLLHLVLAGEAHVVLAAGQLVGGGAHVLDGLQHLLAHAAHAPQRQQHGGGHADDRGDDPVAQAVAGLGHLTAGALVHPGLEGGDGDGAAGPLHAVFRAVGEADRQRLVGLAFGHEGAGHRVVMPLGGGKGDLLQGLDGFGFAAHPLQRDELGLLEAEGPHARPDGLPRAIGVGRVGGHPGDHPAPEGGRLGVGDGRLVALADGQDRVVVGEVALLAGDHVAAHEAGEGVHLAAQVIHPAQGLETMVLLRLGATEGVQDEDRDRPVDADDQQQGRREEEG